MARAESKSVPTHFDRHLAKIREWVAGFEQAGKRGPSNIDTLRQIQNWFQEYKDGSK